MRQATGGKSIELLVNNAGVEDWMRLQALTAAEKTQSAAKEGKQRRRRRKGGFACCGGKPDLE